MEVNGDMNLKVYRSLESSGSVQKRREGPMRAPGKVIGRLDTNSLLCLFSCDTET